MCLSHLLDLGHSWQTNQSTSHKYQQLPLIPVEEFLKQHPEHENSDEDTLMAARIDHERAEREALEQQRQELLVRRQKLIADNNKRKEDLANLDTKLELFIDVCYALLFFSRGILS
jgi:THO complex subunit 5